MTRKATDWQHPTRYFTAWRERAGLSVAELAARSGLPLADLYHFEKRP